MSQDAQVTPATQSTAPVKSGGSKKTVIIILLILVICMVIAAVIGVGLYLVGKKAEKELDNISNEIEESIDVIEEEIDDPAPTAAANEQVYTSSVMEFSIVLPKNWTVNETTDQVEITDENEDTITIQTFTDPAFDFLTEVDQAFCDSFGEGFSEGLKQYTTETISFEVFTLNGNSGCKADANLNLIADISQKYYVLFNTANNKVYSMFYTTLSSTDDTALVNAMESFDFN